ncbi:MAG: endolytic transglycosylase MltG [Syntrophobacteraceae bacterium]|nr:endolytic transglycosylase MltG [Syntrophobacteraceae bacterium]
MSGAENVRRTLACVLLSIAAVILFGAGFLAFQFWIFLKMPGNSVREVRRLTIQPGTGAFQVAELLHRHGVITDPEKFYVLCRVRGVANRLQAGEYAFLPLSGPGRILDQIVQGRVIVHFATLPEGSTLRDVARIMESSGLVSGSEILRYSRDRNFIAALDLDVPSLEGYLFPDTYHFSKPLDAPDALKAMVRQFHRRLPEGWRQRSRELGMDLHEVVIMASLIEKEAVLDSERPIISAVFHNRLRIDMPLQSDPTAVYDLADFSGAITSDHLKRNSPYNTYVNKGLPPGPICNPGARSIEAALYPLSVRYLYFVSNSDGTHHFSETLSEHRKAVARYRERQKVRSGREGVPAGSTPPESGENQTAEGE